MSERLERTTASRSILPALAALVMSGCSTPERSVLRVLPSRTEAEAATQAGDWKAAAERWYALFMADPGRPIDACAAASRAFLALKDAESASHVLDMGLTVHATDADLLELKGEALVALGFRRAAEDYFDRALAVDPRRVTALVNLGKLRIDLGLESAAVKPLRRAVEITGGDFQTWRLLAKAERESNNPRGAYESWVRAFTMGEGSVEDLVEAASLFVDESFRKAHPESGEQMIHWLQSAIAREPQCARAHFQLGVLSEEMGQREDAVEHYRRAVEIDPSCLMALTNLAVLYSSLGQEQGAREMVTRALTLEQDGNRRKALQKLLDPFDRKSKSGEIP